MKPMIVRVIVAATCCACAVGATQAGDSERAYLSRAPQTMALALGSGDASFHRLRQDCNTMAGGGASAVYYDTVTIQNPNAADVTLDVRTQPPGGDGTMACDVNRDTVMMAYSGSFNPSAPMQNCIAYNDDAASPNLDRCSRISGVTIPANGSVVVVVAAFANGDGYPYDLRFDGTTLRTDGMFADGFDGAVAAPPGGTTYTAHALSGQVVVDDVMAAFPAGSWVDTVLAPQGQFAGVAQIAPITLSGMTDFGLLTTRLQWFDTSGGFGQVPANGAGSLSFNGMQLRLQSVQLNGSPIAIGGECRFTPISWGLDGVSTASSIDVSDAQFTIPNTSDSCGGLQAQLNALFGGTSNSVDWSLAR